MNKKTQHQGSCLCPSRRTAVLRGKRGKVDAEVARLPEIPRGVQPRGMASTAARLFAICLLRGGTASTDDTPAHSLWGVLLLQPRTSCLWPRVHQQHTRRRPWQGILFEGLHFRRLGKRGPTSCLAHHPHSFNHAQCNPSRPLPPFPPPSPLFWWCPSPAVVSATVSVVGGVQNST